MENKKQPTKTELFKEHMQAMILQTLGVKVSKQKAWDLFKNTINGTLEFAMNQEDGKVSLSGIGSFEVRKTKPRGQEAGFDPEGNPLIGEDGKPVETWEYVPRFKFYPSSRFDSVLKEHFKLVKPEKPTGFGGLGIYAAEGVGGDPVVAEDLEPETEELPEKVPPKEEELI